MKLIQQRDHPRKQANRGNSVTIIIPQSASSTQSTPRGVASADKLRVNHPGANAFISTVGKLLIVRQR